MSPSFFSLCYLNQALTPTEDILPDAFIGALTKRLQSHTQADIGSRRGKNKCNQRFK